MSIQARLRTLERLVKATGAECIACGGPQPGSTGILFLPKGATPGQCKSCGRILDDRGVPLLTPFKAIGISRAAVEAGKYLKDRT